MVYYQNKRFCYCEINFCSILCEITAVLTVQVAIHGPCCVNRLSTRDEAIQYERPCFLRYQLLKLILFTYLPDYLKCQFLLTIHASALKQGIVITKYVVLSWAMR